MLKFTVTTNATLLTDNMIDFFLKHDFTMVFSLDGPKSIQDRNRVFPNGHGTYDIVMSKIFRMYESDPNKLKGDAISMVVTPEHSFDEIVQLLSEPTLQNVNLLYSYVEENSETILPSREYLEQYRYCSFVSLVEYLRGQGKMYQNKLMESDMTGIEADLDRFISHEPVNTSAPSGPCIPGRNRLFVNCFGSFYPCEKVSEDFCMNIGSIDSGFDVSKVASILNIGQLDSQKCQNCFAFTLCSVCAKYVDGGESLSVEKREKACQESKNSAYNQIFERILFYENSLHLSSIKVRKEVKV